MAKRLLSFLLVFTMCLGLVPTTTVNAKEKVNKLNVIPIEDGSYMIELPASNSVRRSRTKRSIPTTPNTITPENSPDKFEDDWVNVDIAELLTETLGIKEVKLIVYSRPINYSREYTVKVDGNIGNGEHKLGQRFRVPIPNGQKAIFIKFPDGRDSRAAVEALSKPTGLTVNIDFLAHTGVRTEWYGAADKPTVKAKYIYINNGFENFDLPIVNQNSILRIGERWLWKDHTPIGKYFSSIADGNLKCNDIDTATQTFKVKINDKEEGQLGNSNYYFKVTGSGLVGFNVTSREKVSVDFESGKGTWKAPATKPTTQYTGHSLTVKDEFTQNPKLGPITVPNTATELTPPAAKAGQPENEFKGWSVTGQDGPTVDLATYKITGNTVFTAIYGPKAQGKVAIQYVDKSGTAIDNKYKVQGVDYPKFAEGNKGEDVDAKSIPQPAFIGYERNGDIVVTGKKYDENGRFTVEVPYKKLDSVIPEKKNGNDNPDATSDVKKHYAKVTYQVDTKDAEKAKLQLNGTDATSPLVYYVNPVEEIAIKDVANVAAVSKDTNLYNVVASDMWTYDPNTINGTDYKIVQARDTQDNVVKTEITLTAKVADKTAVKFKDKLDPQDIKVWKGDTIDWKNGVKLKEANEELQKILDKTETKVTDQSNRKSDAENLPNGQKGDLLVTFEDGSTIEVKDQTLYVAPHKNDDNTNLPKDAVKVDFKIGEGVTGTEKTEYVKPDTDVKNDAPAVSAKEGFKDAKWYKGDAVATDADYKVKENAVFTAKATGKDKVVKLDDPEKPTNFPNDPTDNSKNDADYVTVKFVADTNGKIKEGEDEKAKGIAYAVLRNTEWADAVTGGVVVPTVDAQGNAPKLVGKDKFYSFKEWQKDGAKVTEFAKVDDNVTYTAVFGKADELTVNYNLNAPEGLTVGGTAPIDTDKYLKDEEVTVKALTDDNTLAGYKFNGWNTQADGKGTAYVANDKFAIKANTELFAQWEKTANNVIPVDNKNDKNGKNGEEIPDNYVFVEFKVKDDDADKANIKDGEQAKFKVDPKATVTLPAPTLELKDAYKKSHNASFTEAEYTKKVFAQATTIFASVTEKGKVTVKYVFETNPNTKTLPDALMALKPEDLVGDKAVYEDSKPADPQAPDTSSKAALVEMKDGKKVGEWKAGDWAKKIEDGNITYTLTWTFKEVEKEKPTPSTPSRPSGPSTPSKPESGRVHGKDRVETAIEISKKYFGKANTVIVVDRKDFPDAMTASVLSKLLKAPILLTDTHKLDPRVAAEIQRLGAKDVIVVGGNKSVSEAVKKELAKFDKDTVERIYGRDRYETSAQVARRVVGITGKLGHGVVASGQVFADALTVAPYASREGYPILLVRANNLPKSVKDAITELAINKVTIAGGYSTVNKSLEASLPTVAERLSGRTRYETAIDIATKKFNTNKIFLANGEHWMDALVIGPVGGILDMPILLTQANSAPQSLKDYIAKSKIEKITAIGGTSMVSDRVLNELSK